MSERKIDPNKAVDFIIENASKFAKARAERVYIEQYRSSLKAILMQKSGQTVISAQERDAYAHPEYGTLLEGLREAVEIEERLRWDLIAAQARIEIWRSQEATNRTQDKMSL